jgi:hypothetical protein
LNVIDQVIEDRFAIYNGDSVEIMQGVPSNSTKSFLRHLRGYMFTQIQIGTLATLKTASSFMNIINF